MKVKELIEKLQGFNPEREVKIDDSTDEYNETREITFIRIPQWIEEGRIVLIS